MKSQCLPIPGHSLLSSRVQRHELGPGIDRDAFMSLRPRGSARGTYFFLFLFIRIVLYILGDMIGGGRGKSGSLESSTCVTRLIVQRQDETARQPDGKFSIFLTGSYN